MENHYNNLIYIYTTCINNIKNNSHYHALIFRRFYDEEIFKLYIYYDLKIILQNKNIINDNDNIINEIDILQKNSNHLFEFLNYDIINYVKNLLSNNINLIDNIKYIELYVIYKINNYINNSNQPLCSLIAFHKLIKYLKLLETKFYDDNYNYIDNYDITNINNFYDNWENIFCYYKYNNKKINFLTCLNKIILHHIIIIIDNIENHDYLIHYINNLPIYYNITIH
jgi:hypothetical protein